MKLILDFDSTLCDFMTPWYQWLVDERFTNYLYKSRDIPTYYFLHEQFGNEVMQFFLKDPFYAYSLIKPFPRAQQFVEWCRKEFKEVEIVTHSSQPTTEAAKLQWIMNYFDMDEVRFFSVMEEKVKHVADSVLVDDYPLHIIKHMAQNKRPGIVFDWQGGNGWSKLNGYVELLKLERPNLGLYSEAHDYEQVKILLGEYSGALKGYI